MKKIKKKLEPKWYKLLKQLDFSEIKDQIYFDDENCLFETDSNIFDIIFNENIVAYGMDKNRDQCSEYGRQLYMLYDLIFFSDAFDVKEE